MFKKRTWLILVFLLPLIILWTLHLSFVRPSDLTYYKSLIQNERLASSTPSSTTSQKRTCVRKDIWFSQDNHSRLHYHILSQGSTLTLSVVKNKFEVIETLEGIQCWMQDKLFSEGYEEIPMQQARYIEADEGLYRFNTQEFTASKVKLALFRLPGHELPLDSVTVDKPFLSGFATDIFFLFSGKTPQFQAAQFKAVVTKEL